MIDTARLWRVALLVVIFSLISTIFGAIIAHDSAHAAQTVPYKVNFQGRLTDATGAAKADGQYNIRFRIFSAASGGSALWTETRETTNRVTLTNGLFSVQLGDVTALTPALFTSQPLYLEVELPTPATATCSTAACQTWTEGAMTPRSKFGSAPYAMNSDTLDGLDATDFAQLGSSNAFTGATFSIAGAANAAKFNVSNLFNVDSSSSIISIGASDTTGTLLVLDTKTSAGDPTGSNGAMYYNSNLGRFRCYQAGSWADCISGAGASGTLQDTYNNSSSPATITTTSAKGILFTSGTNVPTADQLVIDNTGSTGVATSGVNGLNVKYKGGTGAIEGSAERLDLTPGTTSGSTWNGLKIVAGTTGAASGVNEYGINIDGPTSQGAGNEIGISIDANWDAALQLGSKSGEPGLPATDSIYVYASKYAGRSLLSQKGPSGVSFAYQPALFQNTVTQYSPNTTTTGSYIGGAWTIDTTASTASTSTETLGFGTNFATAATANDTAGAYQTASQFMRGSTSGGANGFFSVARIVIPDTGGYGSGATGARIWSGMTNQTSTNMVGSDNPAGHYAGFMYSTNRGDTNWQFLTKDGTTQNVINTNLAFTVNKVYDFYVYVPPLGSTMYWRADNLNDGTTQEGSTTLNLPGATQSVRGSAGIATLTTTARNIRINKFYVESDR